LNGDEGAEIDHPAKVNKNLFTLLFAEASRSVPDILTNGHLVLLSYATRTLNRFQIFGPEGSWDAT